MPAPGGVFVGKKLTKQTKTVGGRLSVAFVFFVGSPNFFFWYSTTENDALIINWVFGSKRSSLHQSKNTRVIVIGNYAKGIHTHFQKARRCMLKPQGPIYFTHLTQHTVHSTPK